MSRQIALLVVAALAGLTACSAGDHVSENTSATSPATMPETVPTSSEPPTAPSTSRPVDADIEAAIAATEALFERIDPTGPGCSASVARGGDVLFDRGYGMADIDSGIAIDTTTKFDIASVGKQFTATLILLLEQDGILRLDDPVSDWVPTLPSWASTITIEQLIHHTAGLPDYAELLLADGFSFDSITTNANVTGALQSLDKPLTAPGTTYLYSNTDYVLLADIAAAATGKNFGDLLAERVFDPLSLDMTLDPTHTAPGIAVGYYQPDTNAAWTPIASGWAQVGDGSITTTTRELVRWSSQYWEPTIGNGSINTERLANASATGQPLFGGLSYGAGILTGRLDDGGTFIGHEGQWGAFSTSWGVVPADQLAVAVSCNATGLSRPTSPLQT